MTITDPAAGDPADWVRGINVPNGRFDQSGPLRTIDAQIDRPAHAREFCALAPGTLVIPEDALDDESGPTDMYYALWWEQKRIGLKAGAADYACIIPNLTLEPDRCSGAPCPVDGVYASVFRIAGRPPSEIYCTSGIHPVGGNEFLPIYHEGGFRGLDFELVWEGEAKRLASVRVAATHVGA